MMILFIEDDYPVLFGATKELFSATLGHAFNQYFVCLADAALVGCGRETVLQGDDFVQSSDFHFFGDIVREMLGGVCSRSFAVSEHECRVVGTSLHERE